jgi:NitT/TauT family transport system substrate-binding protein
MKLNKCLLALCCLGVVASGAKAAEDVTYLLPAPATLPAFGPWMIAQQKGYYAAEGLNVRFVAAKGGVDVAKQIGAGNAVIGGAMGDTPIIVRSNGVPVKAVAILGGRSMTQLVTKEGGPIKSPKDLKGKTVTVIAYQDTSYYSLLGMMRASGLSKSDVKVEAAGPAGVWQLFAAGKADAMAGVPDWTANIMDTGAKVKIFPSDTYFKSMAQSILASDEVIQKNPALVQKLVRATLKGMKDIMADPKAATQVYVQAVPSYKGKEAYIEKVFNLYKQYVYPGQKVVGQIDVNRLQELQKFYISQGVVTRAVPVNELYTNQFVK